LLIFLLTGMCVNAQSVYSISGRVTDENQKPLSGVTIFVDDSQIATATNATGYFRVNVPGAGAYRLSTQMLGYAADTKDVMLKTQLATLDFTLKIKPVELRQVNIDASKKAWSKNFEIFKTHFLGMSLNAQECKIINPKIINFSTQKNMLLADADDFLIIENPRLGYRIKYLLKTFQYNQAEMVTAYDGDVVFEELEGSKSQKRDWTANRLRAYNGSVMHYMRSVYTNTSLQEGFITHQIYKEGDQPFIDKRPVDFDTLATKIDSNFIALKFDKLHVEYDRDKAAKLLKQGKNPNQVLTLAVDSALIPKQLTQDDIDAEVEELTRTGGSITISYNPMLAENPKYKTDLLSYVKRIVIDARGRITSSYFLSFMIRGDWNYFRVADQLPFEYQPPAKTATTK
jgi:hypothetical protein